MPHLLPLLIRGINNLSDARYCAGMGADKLTFVLDPALPGHLDARTVKELAGWVAGVELIGEFDQLSAPEINALAAECALDAVLLRSYRGPVELAEIAPPVYQELHLDRPEFWLCSPCLARRLRTGAFQRISYRNPASYAGGAGGSATPVAGPRPASQDPGP